MTYGVEHSILFPFSQFVVPRSKKIEIEYLDEALEEHTQVFENESARWV
jgi:peptide deformylase